MSAGNMTPFVSPISDLAAEFTCQSLDTPRRRLSLDTNSSGCSGTPITTPSPVLRVVFVSATPQSDHSEVEEGRAGPVVKTSNREDNLSISPSRTEMVEVDDSIMLVDQSKLDALTDQALSVPLSVVPPGLLRPSSESSGDCGVLISPALSPVFIGDEESGDREPGALPEASSKTTRTGGGRGGSFLQARARVTKSDSCIAAKGTHCFAQERDDDIIFEAMELDEVVDVASGPISALLQEKILYGGGGKRASSACATNNEDTPLKRKMHVGRHTRCYVMRENALKRGMDENDDDGPLDRDRNAKSDVFKRRRSVADSGFTSLRAPLKPINRCHSEADAFSHLLLTKDTSCHLIGDNSKPYALPIIERPLIPDLTCISSDTLKRLISDEFGHVLRGYTLIDCRYPYEYEGGHIKGSINLHAQEQLISHLLSGQLATSANNVIDEQSSTRHICVFYCEFSRERGPRMVRFLRKCDRKLNEHQYPKLFYPEIYLLDGGYKNFYATCEDLCEPRSYREMHDDAYVAELRKFRSKSKSWCGGGDAQGGAGEVPTSSRRTGLNRGLFNSSKGY